MLCIRGPLQEAFVVGWDCSRYCFTRSWLQMYTACRGIAASGRRGGGRLPPLGLEDFLGIQVPGCFMSRVRAPPAQGRAPMRPGGWAARLCREACGGRRPRPLRLRAGSPRTSGCSCLPTPGRLRLGRQGAQGRGHILLGLAPGAGPACVPKEIFLLAVLLVELGLAQLTPSIPNRTSAREW